MAVLSTGFVPFFRNNFPGLFQDFSRLRIDFSRTPKFTLTLSKFYYFIQFNRFPGLSRTSSIFPGLSRISRTRTNPVSTNLLIIRHNNLHLGSTNERDKNKSNTLSHGKCIKKKFIYLLITSTIWSGTHNREEIQFKWVLTDNPPSPGEVDHNTRDHVP